MEISNVGVIFDMFIGCVSFKRNDKLWKDITTTNLQVISCIYLIWVIRKRKIQWVTMCHRIMLMLITTRSTHWFPFLVVSRRISLETHRWHNILHIFFIFF